MAGDIASLGIKVTTQGVDQASSGLDKLAKSGDNAAKSTSNLNKSFNQGGGIDRPAKAAAQAVNQQTAALAKLAGQIDPTIAKLDKLDALQAQLGKFKASGAIDAESYQALNAALETSRSKVGAVSTAMHGLQLNSAASRREIGYITKDLATGQYGRLSQSLSTLAVRSGALSLLLNPLTIAFAAAAGAVALFVSIASRGSDQLDAFNKSLILTGGYAGKTADQLSGMASSFKDVAGGSVDAAAAGLAEVAASGKFTGEQFDIASKAAIQFKDATGQAIKETVNQFAELQKDPVQGILKLNETYHFLTQSQLDNIRTLQDQGRETEAATEAFRLYGAEINSISPQVINNLSTTSKIWRGIKAEIDDATNAVERFGKSNAGFTEKSGLLANPLFAALDFGSSYLQAKGTQSANKDQFSDVKGGIVGDSIVDSDKAKKLIDFQKEGLQYATKQQKMEAAIAKAKAEGLAAGASQLDIDKRIAAIRESYAEKAPKGRKPSTADPFASLNGLVQKAQVFDQGIGDTKTNNQQAKDILAIVDAGAKLIASGHDVAQVQAQVAKGVAALNDGYAKQAQILAGENATAIKQYQASLDKQNAALQKSVDAQLAAITLGPKQAQQQMQLAALTEKNAEALTDLQLKRDATKAKGGDTTVLDANIVALQKNMDAQVKIVEGGWADIDAAQANGLNGVHAAIAKFMQDTQNNAEIFAQITTSFLGGFGDAFANFVSGTESAKKAFGSLIDDMYKQALKFVANKAIAALFDSFGASGANATPGSSAGGWGSLFSNLVGAFSKNANGGVYTSPSLSAYSGQVVSKPTMFAFANGAGLMGEAGPEAILPLHRGGDGKLGVQMAGGSGQRGAPIVNQTIVVQGKIDRRTSGQIAQDAARQQRIAQTRNG